MKRALNHAPAAEPVKIAKESPGNQKAIAADLISSGLLDPSQDALIRWFNAENPKVPIEYYLFPGVMASRMVMNALEKAASGPKSCEKCTLYHAVRDG